MTKARQQHLISLLMNIDDTSMTWLQYVNYKIKYQELSVRVQAATVCFDHTAFS